MNNNYINLIKNKISLEQKIRELSNASISPKKITEASKLLKKFNLALDTVNKEIHESLNPPQKDFFSDFSSWSNAVDHINETCHDSFADYETTGDGKQATVDGKVFAKWSNSRNKGYVISSGMNEGVAAYGPGADPNSPGNQNQNGPFGQPNGQQAASGQTSTTPPNGGSTPVATTPGMVKMAKLGPDKKPVGTPIMVNATEISAKQKQGFTVIGESMDNMAFSEAGAATPQEKVGPIIKRVLGKALVYQPGWSKLFKDTRRSKTQRVDDYKLKYIKVIGAKPFSNIKSKLKKALIMAGYNVTYIGIHPDLIMLQTRQPISVSEEVSESQINELSKDTLKSYVKKAKGSVKSLEKEKKGIDKKLDKDTVNYTTAKGYDNAAYKANSSKEWETAGKGYRKALKKTMSPAERQDTWDKRHGVDHKLSNRHDGIGRADHKLKEAHLDELYGKGYINKAVQSDDPDTKNRALDLRTIRNNKDKDDPYNKKKVDTAKHFYKKNTEKAKSRKTEPTTEDASCGSCAAGSIASGGGNGFASGGIGSTTRKKKVKETGSKFPGYSTKKGPAGDKLVGGD